MSQEVPERTSSRSYGDAASAYTAMYEVEAAGAQARREQYRPMVENFYDLVTDFYEYGWGDSFHFAPRFRGERFRHSIERHQKYLAGKLQLGRADRVLDLGCGVGGPMMTIARATGARVTGVNINDYQIQKGRKYLTQRRLESQCEFLKADFMALPVAEGSYTAAYSIESTCHAPDKAAVFRQIHRALEPGGCYAGYDWCTTAAYRPTNPEHQRVKADIEMGNGIPELMSASYTLRALHEAGFEVLECCDRAAESHPDTPWWRALTGRDFSLTSLPRLPVGRALTRYVLTWLEKFAMAPRGSVAVQDFLCKGADALVAGGKLGIFTPMYYFLVRKPRGEAAHVR